jgi:2-amino-4-hydroxy-6-hydroxymethyldihydropteridine diphosphokinase
LHTVYLLLGSNKGDRLQYLLLAEYLLQQNAGNIVKRSPVYLTEPWGKKNKSSYLNQGIILETDKTPFHLLRITQKIEKILGRTNKHHNADRVIDIDILFYDDVVIAAHNLIIPHPRLHLRNFTLQPLLYLNRSYKHPQLLRSIEQLVKDCADTGKVSIFNGKEPKALEAGS